MIIYIVTSGEYSDYRIQAVFTDPEKAKNFCRLHNPKGENGVDEVKTTVNGRTFTYCPDFNIEDYETDPDIPTAPKGLFGFIVHLSKCGEVSEVMDTNIAYVQSKTDIHVFSMGCSFKRRVFKDTPYMTICVLAKDAHHAVKIANEKRAQLIAYNLWPEDFNKNGIATIPVGDSDEV